MHEANPHAMANNRKMHTAGPLRRKMPVACGMSTRPGYQPAKARDESTRPGHQTRNAHGVSTRPGHQIEKCSWRVHTAGPPYWKMLVACPHGRANNRPKLVLSPHGRATKLENAHGAARLRVQGYSFGFVAYRCRASCPPRAPESPLSERE